MPIIVYTAVRQILNEQVITIKMKKNNIFLMDSLVGKIILVESLVENL